MSSNETNMSNENQTDALPKIGAVETMREPLVRRIAKANSGDLICYIDDAPDVPMELE